MGVVTGGAVVGVVVVGAMVEELEELEDELVDGRVVEVVGDPSESSEGTAVTGFGTPTTAVLDTLGCARPAGPAAKARRMFSVTLRIRQRIVEAELMASPQLTSSSSGDHPNVPALNTPAPLAAEYHVESAKELRPLQFTGERAITWMFGGVGTPAVTRSYSLPTIFGMRSPLRIPDPSNTQAEASATTQSALTGLHS